MGFLKWLIWTRSGIVYKYIWVGLKDTAWCLLITNLFFYFFHTIFIYFCNLCQFFSFVICSTIQNFFLTFSDNFFFVFSALNRHQAVLVNILQYIIYIYIYTQTTKLASSFFFFPYKSNSFPNLLSDVRWPFLFTETNSFSVHQEFSHRNMAMKPVKYYVVLCVCVCVL